MVESLDGDVARDLYQLSAPGTIHSARSRPRTIAHAGYPPGEGGRGTSEKLSGVADAWTPRVLPKESRVGVGHVLADEGGARVVAFFLGGGRRTLVTGTEF